MSLASSEGFTWHSLDDPATGCAHCSHCTGLGTQQHVGLRYLQSSGQPHGWEACSEFTSHSLSNTCFGLLWWCSSVEFHGILWGGFTSGRPRLDGAFSHIFMEICTLSLGQGQLQDFYPLYYPWWLLLINGTFYLSLYINNLFTSYINPLPDNKYSSYFPQLWYFDHRFETDLTEETRNEETTDVCTEKPGLGG